MTTAALLDQVRRADWVRRLGRITHLVGTTVESEGPDVRVGEICEIGSDDAARGPVSAEVVGLRGNRAFLMPYAALQGVKVGSTVRATRRFATARAGNHLLGRVLDGVGAALDGLPLGTGGQECPLHPVPLNPLTRASSHAVLETGIKAIDTLLPLARGQRIGIFSGSGVGKTTLIEMLQRFVAVDISVVALIGERGREAHALIEKLRAADSWHRTVVIVATSDQPALVRRRAAFLATAIAEYFCDTGLQVCLTMDSLTRFAMAQREIGLAAGELPTARGYTPSVFDLLPRLLERGGVRSHGGSLTGLYTVLVEGDDMADPVADNLRAILDGHIILSRDIAQRSRFPAIDITRSVSRLASSILTVAEQQHVRDAVQLMAAFETSRDLVELGAYKAGANPTLDRAVKLMPSIEAFLAQEPGQMTGREAAMMELRDILSPGRAA